MKISNLPTRAEDLFCHAVYTSSHVINRAYAPFLKELGVTYPQYISLTLLWERDDQKISELAHQLEMKTSTLTPLVKRLETLGLITRTRGKVDERHVFVTLTPTGRSLQARAPDVTQCMIKRTSLSQLELEQLQKLLTKLRVGFGEHAGS